VTASRWLVAIHFAIVALFIGVVLILVTGFGVSLFGFGLHHPSSAPAPAQAPPNATSLDTSSSPPATTPPETTAPTPPEQVVENYYDAINAHDYQTAWALLGGSKPGQTYQQFVAGFSSTVDDALTITGVNGNIVTIELVATQDDGSIRTYRGTYTIQGGRIVKTNIRRVS
jgi:eukaryotic-like serine/threonine-protein kinase